MSKDSINYFLIQEAEKLLIVEKEFKAAIRFPFIVGLTLMIVTKTKKSNSKQVKELLFVHPFTFIFTNIK